MALANGAVTLANGGGEPAAPAGAVPKGTAALGPVPAGAVPAGLVAAALAAEEVPAVPLAGLRMGAVAFKLGSVVAAAALEDRDDAEDAPLTG